MKSKNMIKVMFPFIALALLMGCATQKAVTTTTAVDLNSKVESGQFVQRVNAFEVIFDSSSSMNETYKGGTKMKQEKDLLSLFDKTIPNLKLTAAERVFGKFNMFGESTTKLLYGPTDYAKSVLTKASDPMEGNGFSPLDAALDGATADLQSQSGQLAVIAFSDGEDMEKYAPVAAAQRLKSAYGDRVCIYTVHLGDNGVGRKLMQEVADAGQCGFMAIGDDLSKPQAMADFVENVFQKQRPATRAQAQAQAQAQEAPKVVVVEPVTIEPSIQFAFDKSNIQSKYYNEIKKMADYMTRYPETKAAIEGHTDNIGTGAYNMKLSQKRANSIKNYLVSKFKIDPSRIKTTGYSFKKPIASNSTKEGRQKNRRATVVFSSTTK